MKIDGIEMEEMDKILVKNIPPTKKHWWKFWTKNVDPNGVYVVRGVNK